MALKPRRFIGEPIQAYFRTPPALEKKPDLYFDRAPDNADRRKGGWYVLREMESV